MREHKSLLMDQGWHQKFITGQRWAAKSDIIPLESTSFFLISINQVRWMVILIIKRKYRVVMFYHDLDKTSYERLAWWVVGTLSHKSPLYERQVLVKFGFEILIFFLKLSTNS